MAERLGSFDIIEAPDFNAEGLLIALLRQALGGGTKFVTRLHTPSSILRDLYRDAGARGLTSTAWALLYSAEKLQIRCSDAIHSPTRIAARIVAQAMRLSPENIEVIPNGVDIGSLRRYVEAQHPAVPKEYILFFGRLEPRKGVHVLAEALRVVFKRHPRACFVLVGKDTPFQGSSMKDWVLRMNKGNERNLVFTGHVSEDCKKTLIKNSRFVVLPSLSEGFGYSCLEAMALGKAVIATAGTGFEEIVDKDSGFLVPAGDSLSLANQICYCIEKDLIGVERNATERSLDFDINRLIDDYIRFYRNSRKVRDTSHVVKLTMGH